MALATAYALKYREDPFLRTEYAIIALQIGFALVTVFTVWGAFTYISRDLTATLATIIPDRAVTLELEATLNRNFAAVVGAIILATAAFGYLIARLALIPSRNALQAQKQFIGNIAHELRTPLSIIKTNTEVRLMDKNLSEEAREMHENNVEELDRISNIINNLLSLSSFVRPERIEFADVDLGNALDAAILHLTPLARKKSITLSVKKTDFCMVWGNASALEQIATNVIKNAINYTPKDGQVAVSIEPGYHDTIELSVRDSGVGIAQKDLYRIFEPFYRSDVSRTKMGATGAGLGLTIVSELIKLHRGKIIIQSTLKRGTIVRITLPCGSPGNKNADAKAGDQVAIDFT